MLQICFCCQLHACYLICLGLVSCIVLIPMRNEHQVSNRLINVIPWKDSPETVNRIRAYF